MKRLCAFLFTTLAFAQEPAPPIDKLLAAARMNLQRDDMAAAKESMEQARKLAEELPQNSPKRYDVFKQSVAVFVAAGEYAEGESSLNLAINWRETVNRQDPKITDELLEMAQIARLRLDYDRSLDILQRVWAARGREKGFDSLEVADIFSLIAQVYLAQEKFDATAGTLTAAVDIRAKVFGGDHPSMVPDLDRLAAVQATLRSYDKSEESFRRVLLIRESVLGRNDADLLATLDGLAYALFGQRKHDEAEKVYKRLLDLWTLTSGGEHPMLALVHDKLALLYRDAKREPEGKAAADRANEIRTIVLARGLMVEATSQTALGDRKAAAALLRQALDVLKLPYAGLDKTRTQASDLLKELESPAVPKKAPPRDSSGKK